MKYDIYHDSPYRRRCDGSRKQPKRQATVDSSGLVGDGRIDKTPGYMQIEVPLSDWVALNRNPNAGIGVNDQGDYCIEVNYTHDGSISLNGVVEMVTRKCGFDNAIDATTAARAECKWWREEMERRKSPTVEVSRRANGEQS